MSRKGAFNNYKLLRDFMDHIPDVVYFKDRKGKLILVNKAHAKGLGLEPKDVIGKTDFDIFPRARARLMAKDDNYVLTTGKPIIDKIERATRPDGVDNYVTTTKIPRYDKSGRIIGLIGITRGITQRMQIERVMAERDRLKKKLEASEELSKMKSEFVSGVSHELRTPLTIVKEAVALLLDEIKGPINKEQKEIISSAQSNIEHLKKITEDLLDVSRIERGKIRLRYSLVNLNDLVKDSKEFFQRLTEEKGINLEYRLPKEEIDIFIDPDRVSQIISNLIDNAVKFTERGGKIRVELKVFEEKVRLGVIDTGIGIAGQDLPKVFHKFVQVGGRGAVKNKGIGLGLTIVKELVERHGGEIWADSKLGIGSSFYFTLPRFFSANILGREVREEANKLLNQGISLYLVNLLIVNYAEFQRLIRVENNKLTADLKAIIEAALKEFKLPENKKAKVFWAYFHRGECNIILPKATGKEIIKFCGLLKDRINRYFIKNKIGNIFVNIGVVDISYRVEPDMFAGDLPHIHVKRIHIGAEKRRFQRVACKLDIETALPKAKLESSQTVDISEGGLCFATGKKLDTNACLRIKLHLPGVKKALSLTGRVAWIKEVESPRLPEAQGYKVGLEFAKPGREERRKISRFIKSVSK